MFVKWESALTEKDREMMHLLLRSDEADDSSDDSGSEDSTLQQCSPSERALHKVHQRYDSSRIKAIDCVSMYSLVHD